MTKTRFPFDRFLAGHFFKQSFYSGFFDPLKRKLFFMPVRWHAKPVNERWDAVEQHAMAELLRWVTPPNGAGAAGETAVARPLGKTQTNLPLSLLRPLAYAWIFRHRIAQLCGRMLRGDRETFSRVVWFARSFVLGTGNSSPPSNK